MGSYGYHGDDGKKFLGSGAGEDYGPTFGTGDTVGAGIHMGRQELFFTKNGTKLKVAHRPVRPGLYPTIGLHSKGEMVIVNFGQKPWVFDLEGMIAEDQAAQRVAVERIPVSSGTTHALVRQYLLHYGYADTLKAFDAAAGLTGSEEGGRLAAEDAATCLPLRRTLRRQLMAGDVDGALGELRAHCPAVLEQAGRFGDVHFALACQKYIELVRDGQMAAAVSFAQTSLAQLRGASAAALETQLRDVIALIAYAQPASSPLAHFLSQTQREAVADAVNAAVLAVLESKQVGASGAGGSGSGSDRAPAAAGEGAEGASSSEDSPMEDAEGAQEAGGAELRPTLAARGAAARRPASHVEQLMRQLAAVQATLHEASGGQGPVFDLQATMLRPLGA